MIENYGIDASLVDFFLLTRTYIRSFFLCSLFCCSSSDMKTEEACYYAGSFPPKPQQVRPNRSSKLSSEIYEENGFLFISRQKPLGKCKKLKIAKILS